MRIWTRNVLHHVCFFNSHAKLDQQLLLLRSVGVGWFSCRVRDVWTEKQEHCAEIRQRDREITVSAASENKNAFGLIATLFLHVTTQLQEWTLHGAWM